jgi:hypothetical protein
LTLPEDHAIIFPKQEQNIMRDRIGAVWAGLGLVGLGVAFLLAQAFGWGRIWPIFPLIGGLAFLGSYVATGFTDGGLAFIGTAATLIGLFFFGFTLGVWEWANMARLWPAFPIIGGVAFVVLFLADRAHDLGVLGLGLSAIVVGGAGLAILYGYAGRNLVQWWPVLLILIGAISLLGAVVRMLRGD